MKFFTGDESGLIKCNDNKKKGTEKKKLTLMVRDLISTQGWRKT